MIALVVRSDWFVHECGTEVHTEWWWSPDRPAEVHLAVDSVEWVIGRDLLMEGVLRPTGAGDVRFWPWPSSLWVHLSSPHGEALLHGSLRVAEDFLARTWKACPRWVESARVDAALDAFLTEVGVQP